MLIRLEELRDKLEEHNSSFVEMVNNYIYKIRDNRSLTYRENKAIQELEDYVCQLEK